MPSAEAKSQADGQNAAHYDEDPLFYAPRQRAWFAEHLIEAALELISHIWALVIGTRLGGLLWRTQLAQAFNGLASNVNGVFLQKLGMFHLKDVDHVGGPARGMTAIVTGPTSGIGTETAAALARRGVTVVLACRSVSRGEDLKAKIQEDTVKQGLPCPDLEVWQLDLASLKSVRAFAARWEGQKRALNILINNAGIYSMGVPRDETEDGFEAHMGANHLGHFLLTLTLMPALRRGAEAAPSFGARVVHVSSSVHIMAGSGIRMSDPHFRLPHSYSSQLAYGQSKLAQILAMKEMRRRLGPSSNIQVFAVHPGMVLTNVVRTLPVWMQRLHRIINGAILLTPSEGARASIYAATSPEAPLEGWKTFGYMDSNCRPISTSPAGEDMLQAAWLWRWSAEQVQLPAELDVPESSE